jgi:hypothetical protein
MTNVANLMDRERHPREVKAAMKGLEIRSGMMEGGMI